MTVQLTLVEVQVAVADYLRRRGVIVEDADQVQFIHLGPHGERMNFVGVTLAVVVNDVKLPEGPYR